MSFAKYIQMCNQYDKIQTIPITTKILQVAILESHPLPFHLLLLPNS